jgi:hypothetical protein
LRTRSEDEGNKEERNEDMSDGGLTFKVMDIILWTMIGISDVNDFATV